MEYFHRAVQYILSCSFVPSPIVHVIRHVWAMVIHWLRQQSLLVTNPVVQNKGSIAMEAAKLSLFRQWVALWTEYKTVVYDIHCVHIIMMQYQYLHSKQTDGVLHVDR